MASWGYTKENGPETWHRVAPHCKGLHQSPVNIDTSKVERCHFPPLDFNYKSDHCTSLLNNGHTAMVKIEGSGEKGYLKGGPLKFPYEPIQFHFHWGRNNQTGSEHQVDGQSYAGELHIVHWNKELYGTFEEAVKCSNGLAVTGSFLKVGKQNKELDKLLCHFSKVEYSGDSVDLTSGFDPASLLPCNHGYWTYSGSLTTPPCYESARFILMREAIQVSESQLNAFRNLKSYKKDAAPAKDEFGGKILQNYRPICALYDRKIISSG